VQVAGLTGVAAIAAGGYSAVAIRRGEPFDLTGYGHNDLLWRNASDGALVYRLMSGSVFTGAFGTIAATILNDWQVVGQPDIDGDGILDLLWQNMSTGDVTYWIMSGSQFAGTWGYVVRGIPLVWRVVAAADMDGDGFPDLVYQNAQTGDVTYLQVVNGQFTGVWGFLSQGIDPIWKVIGAVDLFNDGNNDLVWWNSQTGEVTYLRMQGATWTGEYDYIANTMATVNTSWRAVGMADFTGDGYPDIVWQNTQTGDVTYYEVTISWTGKPQWDGNWGFLAQGTDPVWQLTGMR